MSIRGNPQGRPHSTIEGEIMGSIVKVQEVYIRKKDRHVLFVYLPVNEVKINNIKKGNLVQIDIKNPNPDLVEAPKQMFRPKSKDDEALLSKDEEVQNESENTESGPAV